MPLRTVQEEVSALVAKIQSRAVPLSQCIAEALALGVKAGNTELEEFCRRELEGSTYDRGMERKTISHRLICGYFSIGEVANAHYYPDGDALFSAIAKSENFTRIWFPLLEPISEIEHRKDNSRKDAVVVITQRLGNIDPNTEAPDARIYWYGPSDTFAQIVEMTRTALTKKLLSLSATE